MQVTYFLLGSKFPHLSLFKPLTTQASHLTLFFIYFSFSPPMSSSNAVSKNTSRLHEVEDGSWEKTNSREVRSCYYGIQCSLRTS